MKKIYLALCLILSSFQLYADNQFCSISRAPSFGNLLMGEHEHRLDFLNQGGFFNGGVCWWHSRFSRNATYIARFRPDLPAPSEREIKEIVKEIRQAKSIVSIPGYKNLQEFSRENEDLIQKELESWQRFDGLIRQQWVVGLWGLRRIAAHKMKARMDHLYDYVQGQGKIAYLKLQLRGLPAHSWLVIGMAKRSNGYELRIIDSNYRYPISYRYTVGDKSFNSPSYGRFVPYLGKMKENEKIRSLRKSFCQAGQTL